MSLRPRLTLGPGTHAIRGGLRSRGGWFQPGAPFCQLAGEHGIECSFVAWSTGLAGFQFWLPLFGLEPNLQDWEIAALAKKERFLPSQVDPQYWPPQSRVNILDHSHGGQSSIIAASLGLRIGVLVTVSTPVREDVLYTHGERARKNIGYHLEYRSRNDRIQKAGGVGDGHWGTMWSFADFKVDGRRVFKPDQTVVMPEECGHSGLLHNAKYMGELLTAFQIIVDRDGRSDLLEVAS